ncbi:Receptor-type tyrosine-protein phosphatase alpha [Oopsacas minuta]|uniref:protein-tyrosine-phosphatase n=1 Tax=Oopsacas minuta TaxID=111878 RepID=A0AAV7JB91_9METZ|nr:Receptor-type tyrosine-protein phosphatase alpha [Oopsacas minuta]
MHYRYLAQCFCISFIIISIWIGKTVVLASIIQTNLPENIVYDLSRSEEISCEADGAANYNWSRIVNGTDKLVSNTQNLTKIDLLQYGEGNYKCIAIRNNSTVISSVTYSITFEYSTQNPLIAIQSSSNSWDGIQLDWQTNVHTMPISSYFLVLCSKYLAGTEQCTEESRNVELSDIVTVLDTDNLQFNHTLRINDLLPYHRHNLRLTYSFSNATVSIKSTTSTQAGPPVVTNLQLYIKWVELRQLFLTWRTLESKHTSNVSLSYIIEVYKDDEMVVNKNVPLSFENRITLELDGNQNYFVHLCARNEYGINCIELIETGTHQAHVEDSLLIKLPLILIILLAVLIYFALVIICCLMVALFRGRSRSRKASKNAGGEFQLTPPKRTIKITPPRLSLYETERDSGISDNRSHSHTSDEGREQAVGELTEDRIRNSKIPLRHLKPCLDQHLYNNCQLAKEEFADLRRGLLREATVGLLPENKKKNRQPNICPYDCNRVRLEDSYYINASLIDQDWLTFSYITTQGPLSATINSFWQMVWQQGSTVIVMLSPEPCASTCEIYWPDAGETAEFDNIQVTHDSSQIFGHLIQRNFTVTSPGTGTSKRIVTQLHFTIWPQNSLPLHPHFLWQFITKVHRHHTASSEPYPPLLLHCPDGSDQCGLFLVLFELWLELIKLEPSELNVFELIQRLRAERTNFISTAEQYCFIYRALLDQVNRTDTSIQKQNFSLTCNFMNRSVDTTSNHYKELFDSLVQACPDPTPEQVSDAKHPVNLPKNRYEDKLPNNLFRVSLDIRLTGETSDYINASYIDSFMQRRAFIATQGPLEHTVPQFWSMVVSSNASLIVMLTNLYEDGKEMCAHYWPTSTEMLTIKNLQVSFVDELELGPFRQREYLVSSGTQKQKVYQLSLPNWSVAGSLPQHSDIIQLVIHTYRLQRSIGMDKPTIVHCNDGMGRTGTFLSIYMILEQVAYEGVVDIFQTVKGLRVQRPHMVSSLKQYVYCHQTVQEAISKDFSFQ